MIPQVEKKLYTPAIGLIITGITNLLMGFFMFIIIVAMALGGDLSETFEDNAERFGYVLALVVPGIVGVASVAFAPIIIYGAIQMMKGRKYGLAKIASILSVIPFTSCFSPIGIVFGLWSFIVLSRTDTKAYFDYKKTT